MQRFKIVPTREKIHSEAGLALVGQRLKHFALRLLNRLDRSPTCAPEIPMGDLATAYVGSLSTGRKDFSDLERFRHDAMFKAALGLARVPSEASFRQRIRAVAPELSCQLDELNLLGLQRLRPTPTRLGKRRKALLLDVDVSVHDNQGAHQREGVEWTYRKVAGFAPIYAHVGEQGYLLGCQLRPGSQHCQKETTPFLAVMLDRVEQLGHRALVRMDCGQDALENLQLLHARRHWYIIAVNPRGADHAELMEEVKLFGESRVLADGTIEYLWWEEVLHAGPRGGQWPARRLARVTVREYDQDGTRLLLPEEKLQLWWTNLVLPPAEVLELYHQHGTSEQYHSELKSDLDLERLPSGSFEVNAAILKLGMITYNVLRELAVTAIAPQVERRRLRTVIAELVRMAGKLVRRSNRLILRVWEGDPWLPVLIERYHAYG